MSAGKNRIQNNTAGSANASLAFIIHINFGALRRHYYQPSIVPFSFLNVFRRGGEFLAVSGAAAYQPTDGSNVPDYLIAEGSFVPELQVLYSAVCDGSFARLARFEAKPDPLE